MEHPTTPTPGPVDLREDADGAWVVVLAAARHAEALAQAGEPAAFSISPDGDLKRVPIGAHDTALAWHPAAGWELRLPSDDPRRSIIDLYLPVCSATSRAPMTVGHLGQSLDGFIATHAGESLYVTGHENIRHLHRMRALSEAIVVGAGTVAADDPQLTTRRVSGPSPLRVILDPMRRLGEHYKVFQDNAAETLYICGQSVAGPGDTHVGRAMLVAVADTPNGLDIAEVTRLLRARGCHRIFVEGGGVTVSMFLEANLLDRLQVAIAPLIIGSGRPAIRVPARTALSNCHRPGYRVFRMGGDVFFDCDLRARPGAPNGAMTDGPLVTRVI